MKVSCLCILFSAEILEAAQLIIDLILFLTSLVAGNNLSVSMFIVRLEAS